MLYKNKLNITIVITVPTTDEIYLFLLVIIFICAILKKGYLVLINSLLCLAEFFICFGLKTDFTFLILQNSVKSTKIKD